MFFSTIVPHDPFSSAVPHSPAHLGMLVEPNELDSSVVEIRIRPQRDAAPGRVQVYSVQIPVTLGTRFAIDIGRVDRDEIKCHRAGRRVSDNTDRTGEGGGDNWFTQRHCVEYIEPDFPGTVKRHVNVAGPHERGKFTDGEIPVNNYTPDARHLTNLRRASVSG